jgi:hypothetical protein
MYQTERGALLARMEHSCICPGMWIVEGHDLSRRTTGTWSVYSPAGELIAIEKSFTAALQRVSASIP